MEIGVPKEIKNMEKRVALTPAGVEAFIAKGHTVYIEKEAGIGSGLSDKAFERAGAVILPDADSVWYEAEMIVKVKEPLGHEFEIMRPGQILFTYLHLAADRELTLKLLEKKVVGIAYETIQREDGSLPLLAPMSEVAGRLAVQMGCYCLESKNGGRGMLLSGVPGVPPAQVTIIGGGISGLNAAHLAVGMGARVTILDIDIDRLRYLEDIFHSRIVTMMSNPANIAESIAGADLIIGSVLIPGARAPKLISREMLSSMKTGAAFVDIAIDQGGCAESSRPTTHDKPIFEENGVVHYCVTNMPGAVPVTSTYALTNATLPFALELAEKGCEKAIEENIPLAKGLNVFQGQLMNDKVADSLKMECSQYIN